MNRIFVLLLVLGQPAYPLWVNAQRKNDAQPQKESIERLARNFINHLNQGRAAKAFALFGAKLKKDMPSSKLKTVWANMVAQLGQFGGIDGSRTEKVLSNRAVILTGRFSKMRMDLQIVFNAQHDIVGFRVRPTTSAKDGERARPQMPKPPFPYAQRDVAYAQAWDGSRASGTLTFPNAAGRHPAVLLISGSGAQDRDGTIMGHKPFWVIADYLTRRGVVVLRTDDRGRGANAKNAQSADLNVEAHDVSSAITFLMKQPEVDPARIGLIGHSSGGLVASMVASRDERVAFLALLSSPGVPGKELNPQQVEALLTARGQRSPQEIASIVAGQRELMNALVNEKGESAIKKALFTLIQLSQKKTPENAASLLGGNQKIQTLQVETQYSMLTTPWFLSFAKTDPANYLKSVTVPVLVLAGSKDLQVPPKFNLPKIRAALSLAKNSKVTVHLNSGLNHLLQSAKTGLVREYGRLTETIAPKVLEQLIAWLRRVNGMKR